MIFCLNDFPISSELIKLWNPSRALAVLGWFILSPWIFLELIFTLNLAVVDLQFWCIPSDNDNDYNCEKTKSRSVEQDSCTSEGYFCNQCLQDFCIDCNKVDTYIGEIPTTTPNTTTSTTPATTNSTSITTTASDEIVTVKNVRKIGAVNFSVLWCFYEFQETTTVKHVGAGVTMVLGANGWMVTMLVGGTVLGFYTTFFGHTNGTYSRQIQKYIPFLKWIFSLS